MSSKKFFSPILLLALGVFVTLGLLSGCGGDSDSGQLTINGILVDVTLPNTRTRTDGDTGDGTEEGSIETPIVGAIVRAAGQSTVTNQNGEFTMKAFDEGFNGEPIVFEITIDETTRTTTTGTASTPARPDLAGSEQVNVKITSREDEEANERAFGAFFIQTLVIPIIQGQREPTVTPSFTPTPEPTPTPSITPTPSSTSTPEATPTPEMTFSSQFTCENGTYNAGTSQGCGIDKFTLGRFDDNPDQLRVTGFGENEELKFIIIGDDVAEVGGAIIFSVGDHTCQMRCSPTTSITVFCSNTMGGTCQQTLTQ